MKQSGFTLNKLLNAVAIAGVLTVLAIPYFFYERARATMSQPSSGVYSSLSENETMQNERNDGNQDDKTTANQKNRKATFAAGCFWGVEAAFRQVQGVVRTSVGYIGGSVEHPSYQVVCTGQTGHAEAVQVEYDPSRVTYSDLLAVFWDCHDPTTLNRQGPDIGTQYRSAIFYHSPEQERESSASLIQMQKSGRFQRAIVTQLVPAPAFYEAEEYHQQYLEKRGLASCKIQ